MAVGRAFGPALVGLIARAAAACADDGTASPAGGAHSLQSSSEQTDLQRLGTAWTNALDALDCSSSS
jgi:hypothetical protein